MSHSTHARVNLTELALRLSAQRILWQPLIQYDPLSRYYTRLASEPDFEAWLLTWLPGQGTEWHDHGGSAGAFVTLAGTLTEWHATVAPDRAPRIQAAPRELSAGTLRPFGTKHVHQVSNRGPEPAVSLHVYGPALTEMNHYRPQGQQLELVSSECAGVSW